MGNNRVKYAYFRQGPVFMSLFKNKYRIESIRLPEYDYSTPGYYFITICTKNRENLFGEIIHGKLIKTPSAKIVGRCWFDLPNHFRQCALDEFIIVPNHIHGIIVIPDNQTITAVETGLKPVSTLADNANKRYSLSEMVRAFKTFSARRINELHNSTGQQFWQTGYYERIIRNESELFHIRGYIKNNPINWGRDRNNI